MRGVAIASGSPPLTITSRTCAFASSQRIAGSSALLGTAPPPSPTRRERVQNRQ